MYSNRVGEIGHLVPKYPFCQQAKMPILYNRRWKGWGQQRTRERFDKEKGGATEMILSIMLCYALKYERHNESK